MKEKFISRLKYYRERIVNILICQVLVAALFGYRLTLKFILMVLFGSVLWAIFEEILLYQRKKKDKE